jgi:hypothetical protein
MKLYLEGKRINVVLETQQNLQQTLNGIYVTRASDILPAMVESLDSVY